jgi:mono/diheme cytochrome c family protein
MKSSSKTIKNRNWLTILMTTTCVALFMVRAPKLAAQDSAEDLYGHKCAICHGKDGLGNTAKGKKVHVKDVHTNMKDSETQMISVVTNGKGDDMDAYQTELTADQIKGVVDYYRSLGQK